MLPKYGIWRCLCGCELLARPALTGRKTHDKLEVIMSRDHIRRWIYEERNDIFLHQHSGEIGLLRADFVEDLKD